jgi:hypothetical protein
LPDRALNNARAKLTPTDILASFCHGALTLSEMFMVERIFHKMQRKIENTRRLWRDFPTTHGEKSVRRWVLNGSINRL